MRCSVSYGMSSARALGMFPEYQRGVLGMNLSDVERRLGAERRRWMNQRLGQLDEDGQGRELCG